MRERTETHEWQVYELTEKEFRERLGIPDGLHVVTVSTAGGKITIHASHD